MVLAGQDRHSFMKKLKISVKRNFAILPKFLMLPFFFFLATRLAVKALSPNHWSTKEFPKCSYVLIQQFHVRVYPDILICAK